VDQVKAPSASLDTRAIATEPKVPRGRGDGTLAVGQVLQQRYQVLGVLGMGGMSAVYQARDLRFPSVTKLCAVKEMINLAPDPQLRVIAVQNFEREANILATLSHPSIPKVYDYFSERDRAYLVIEYIDGQDLEAYLADSQGLLAQELVLDWGIRLCQVLAYLHSHNPPIIFRDMKPSNVMLDKHEEIRLVDFGIAKLFQTGQKGTMIGTEGYSPPEQYRGATDPRGDVYALGATLHHLLTKQDPRVEPPFSFHERPIKAAHPLVSDQFVEIIDRALEYEPEKRWSSIVEMQSALEALRAPATGGIAKPGTGRMSPGEIEPLWVFTCEDEVRSNPAVAEGVVFVGAYDNNLYAVDAQTGQFKWKYATEGGLASSPCVWQDRVFIGSEDNSLYCINAQTGRIVWTCPSQGCVRSSPRVEYNHVFFGSDDHHLYAANVQTGRVAWKSDTEGPVRSRPAIGDESIYFGCEDGAIYALDIRGVLRWRFATKRAVTSSPTLDEGILYVGSGDHTIYALDVRSGWAVWRLRTGKPVISSPAVAKGTVFVGSVDHSVYALDARTGRQVWKFSTDNQVTSSPAFFEDAVYFGSVDGNVYSLDGRTGTLRWRFRTGGPVTSSPIIADGIVYIGSTDHRVYALVA
jgi:outer membrane protein assembly factor BamB/tRNA A-37 threonylcarbamoyl transferase component Bud32